MKRAPVDHEAAAPIVAEIAAFLAQYGPECFATPGEHYVLTQTPVLLGPIETDGDPLLWLRAHPDAPRLHICAEALPDHLERARADAWAHDGLLCLAGAAQRHGGDMPDTLRAFAADALCGSIVRPRQKRKKTREECPPGRDLIFRWALRIAMEDFGLPLKGNETPASRRGLYAADVVAMAAQANGEKHVTREAVLKAVGRLKK